MGIGNITSANLDYFISECDRRGGVQSKEAAEFISDFSITYSTLVDQNLDPFSDEYFNQQINLYEELSNRKLDQDSGEQAPVDVDRCVKAANPYGIKDINFIAKHARANLTSILVCNPPQGARILDLGCGWGLSSEMAAFCGATVDSVDINPLFVDLVNRRSSARYYDIKCTRTTFDSFQSQHLYDIAMFYECLHHSAKPWETLANIGKYIKPNGKITIAGEPINSLWWKNWGLRLDPLSVYCIRKFGWFESGWSESFISECFYRNGFLLTLLPYIGLDNACIGVAIRKESEEMKPISDSVIPSQIIEAYQQSPANFGTIIGTKRLEGGSSIIRLKQRDTGYALFGPYISLASGNYKAIYHLKSDAQLQATSAGITLDVVSTSGTVIHGMRTLDCKDLNLLQGWHEFSISFSLSADTTGVEARIYCKDFVGSILGNTNFLPD